MTDGEAPIPYVPVAARPWRLAMGMRPLDPDRWLEVDEHRPAELALKARLLASDHDRVTAFLPGSEDAGAELLADVVDHLSRLHPGLIDVRPDGRLRDRATGLEVDPGALHPLDAAARLVQEDLCLMAGDGTGWTLVAASVCFPSRWHLADKIGRDLAAIHHPVAGYEQALQGPVGSLFDRLRPERPMWRLNWTLLDAPDLHQPDAAGRRDPAGGVTPAGPGDPGRSLWFRVERQTLRRSPTLAAVTFTIRTYVTPLGRLVVDHPEVVPALRVALPTVPEDALVYKGWTGLVGPVCDWLDRLG